MEPLYVDRQGNFYQGHLQPGDREATESERAAWEAQRFAAWQSSAMQRLRGVRALVLNALAGIGFDALKAGDTALADAVATARAGLKAVPQHPSITGATNDAQFDAAAKVLYAALVAAAPPAVKVAFKELT